jgi:hypothetical protein
MDGFRMPFITLKTCHKNARSLSFNRESNPSLFQRLLPDSPGSAAFPATFSVFPVGEKYRLSTFISSSFYCVIPLAV